MEKQSFNLSKVEGIPSPRGRFQLKKLTFPSPTVFFSRRGSDCRRGTSRTSTGEVRVGVDCTSSTQSISPSLEFVSSLPFANKFFSLQRRDRRTAFTLAEVLITLGVIGVVAAITLPTVINKINDHNFKVAYKKAYRDVNEAYRMMSATDDGFTEISCTSTEACPTCCYDLNFGNNFLLLAKQFKAVKTCSAGNKTKCLKCPDNSSHECYLPSYGFAFVDNSGRVWAMYNNPESVFYVDTNGDKGPNLTGKDRWGFLLPTPQFNNTNKNFIMPFYSYDISTKNMNCTSGNCKYRSWLIK